MDDENIIFETMPTPFGFHFELEENKNKIKESSPPNVEVQCEEIEYDSLYDELLDKCNPHKFDIETYGLKKFSVANRLYSKLLNDKCLTEAELKQLRNSAIDELNISISSKKKFEELKEYMNPKTYMNDKNYNADLVEKSGRLYDLLLKNQDDIRVLEGIEATDEAKEVKEEYDYRRMLSSDYINIYPNGKYISEVKERRCFINDSPYYYLKKYPNGNFVAEAKNKIREVEIEEILCFNANPDIYMQKYPQGKYVKEALEKQESNCFKQNPASTYLKKYPNGKFVEEAKCYEEEGWKIYLKKYPSGNYAGRALREREERVGDIVAIVTFVLIVTIFIGILLVNK